MALPSRHRLAEGFRDQRLTIVPPAIVHEASQRPVTRDLFVTHIGSFSAVRNHYVDRPRGTSEHILIACLSGGGSCTFAGRGWRLEPGDLLFLPPAQAHVYGAEPKTPWTIFWIHFRGARANDYLESLGVSPERPVLRVGDVQAMLEAFEEAFSHVVHGFGEADLIALSTAFARLLGLAKVHERAPGVRSHRAEARLRKLLTRLRQDLAHAWTLEAMAGEASVSVPHFTELCRRQTGMAPLAFLIRLRLQRAMFLLQRGEHNVAEAARAVGYDDPFYFSRLFKKHIGIAPSQCRSGP